MPTTRERILAVLTERDGFVSGEAISVELGLSRTAVWKHIQRLRADGYDIDSATNNGYRFVRLPELLTAQAITGLLEKQTFGSHACVLETVDSTNWEAKRRAEHACPEGTLILAEQQTGGRGRMARAWFSPPGRNLYMSIVLRPPVAPCRVPEFSLAATLAVIRAVADTEPNLTPTVKWPNDVFLDGRKFCGILCDLDAEIDRVRHLIVGIGINVNMQDTDFPADLRARATSLRIASGRRQDRARLAAAVCRRVEEVYRTWLSSGLEKLLPEWQRHSLLHHRTVTVETPRGTLTGVAVGLSPTGALRLQHPDGEVVDILSGDVHIAGFEP